MASSVTTTLISKWTAKLSSMKRLVAYISGKVQKSGYRSKVIAIARDMKIEGSVQNLSDGRVKVIAEGEEGNLERFAEALKIENAIINVVDIKKEYSNPIGECEGFYKLVGEGETDERLDKSAEYLKELVEVTRDGFSRMDNGFGELGHKMDKMIDKQDQMLDKQDQMLEKQDETTGAIKGIDSKMDKMLDKQDQMISKQDGTTGEIRGLRTDIKNHIDQRFERIETDLGEVKTALKEKGII